MCKFKFSVAKLALVVTNLTNKNMNVIILSILGVVLFIILYIVISLFFMTVNDFIEKEIKKTLWLWLPFHALWRLSGEFKDKYLK